MASSLFHILNISRQDMLGSLYDLDQVSSNLANVNTAGYKSSRTNFQELLDQASLNGVHLSSTQMLNGQGSLRGSEDPLDWAIEGEGFFAVRQADGSTGYTRDGQFKLDGNRRLVNDSGLPLIWSGQVPAEAEELAVQSNGTVIARQGSIWGEIGTVQLTRFANPSGLRDNGQNVWLETANSGKGQTGTPGANGYGALEGAMVEQSNVNMAEEMSHMMTLQRAFQMSVRTFQQTDQMINLAIHMRKA